MLKHLNFQEVHDYSANGVIALDSQGNICYSNPSAADTLFSGENHLGLPVNHFFQNTPSKTAQPTELFRSNLLDEEFLFSPSELEKTVLVSSKAYTDESGETRTYLFVRDISPLKKKEKLLAYLNTAAQELAQARDTRGALKKISSLIVPRFANWFSIDLLQGGKLEEMVLAHEDPNMVQWARKYREAYPTELNSESGTARVVKTGIPLLVPVVTPEMVQASIKNPAQLEALQHLNLQSVITVAILYRDTTMGIISFVSSTMGYHYDEADLDFAKSFASHIGMALENARLNEAAESEIAQRKQVAKELRESGELFRFLADAIPHKLWTSGTNGDVTYYNQGWFDYTGISNFEELKKRVWEFLHPDDLEKSAAEWPLTLAKGEAKTTEQRLRRYDGQYRWHLSRFSPHKDENGNIRLWVGTSTDIHEQKSIQEALETSEAHFRALTQLNSLPIWQVNAKGEMVFVNDTWRSFTGVKTEQINERDWTDHIHPEDREEAIMQFNIAFAQRQPVHLKYRFRHAQSGEYRWMLDNAQPVFDPAFQGYIGTMTDIHEQEQARLTIQDLMSKKDEFISIASHELKTPLTSIKAFNQLMLRAKDSEKYPDFIKRSAEHVVRLEKLINDLLDVSRINAGKMPYNFELFSFGDLLTQSVEAFRHTAPDYEIVLNNELDISYLGDSFRLEQVISNFLTNAIKYSPDTKRIVVAGKTDRDNIIVSVQDFGIGIAKENLDKLFDRYYRVDNTAMRFEGLGLGLFISSEILKRHQGSFWIESEPGEGSTFYFRLPLEQLTEKAESKFTTTFYQDNKITINYNPDKKWMAVDWTGFQDFQSVQRGCMLMRDYLKNNHCDRIVNDNTHVIGNWADAVEWVGNEWFPMMERAGLKYFAHIFSPSTFSALSAQKSIDIMAGIITTQYFTEVRLAEEWIDQCT